MAGDDWVVDAVDTLERGVTRVRSLTTDRLRSLVRYVVFGLLAGIVGVAALVLVTILAVRVIDIVVPGKVWSAHLLVGGIFLVAGLLVWPRRADPASPA